MSSSEKSDSGGLLVTFLLSVLVGIAQWVYIAHLKTELKAEKEDLTETSEQLDRSVKALQQLSQRSADEVRAAMARCKIERQLTSDLALKLCKGQPAMENYIRNRALDVWFR